MKKLRLQVLWYTALVAALLLGDGCTSRQPERYYALSSLAGELAKPLDIGSVPDRWQVIGVGPIALPGYLDHPSVTTRRGDATLLRSEVHRWGGSLRDEVSRVFVENLGHLLSQDHVIVLPWMETPTGGLRVQITISRFEGTEAKTVILNGSWLVFDEWSAEPLIAATEEVREPVGGDEYRDLIVAMSRSLAEMSRRIAKQLKQLDTRQRNEQEP